jgi:hypothetical protein
MSRIDRHVAHVRSKLVMQHFVNALAWAALWVGVLVAVGVLVWRYLVMHWAHNPWQVSAVKWWVLGIGVVAAAVVAFLRRPNSHDAAVEIDQKLGLREKFSTALRIRKSKDPFAQAVVLDAEQTAQNVHTGKQFPIRFPVIGYYAIAALGLAMLLGMTVKPWYPEQESDPSKPQLSPKVVAEARQLIEKAEAVAKTLPPELKNDLKLKADAVALADLLKHQYADPAAAARKAQEIIQDQQKALADEAAKVEARAQSEERTFAQAFGDPADYKSPEIKKMEDDLKKGKFEQAVNDFSKAADNFDKMSQEEKDNLAKDMQQLAQRLENAGQDPNIQKDIQDKLQQMGASQQQAQQMAQQMQQAAQGDKQAQQQLAQQAQQMQQQLQQQIQQAQQQAAQGNQQAQQQVQQLQQQQQQIQQAIQSMQGQANAQAQAQQMGQAAQQMAQAMQQQAQAAQQGQQGQQPQGQQQANQQQMAQAKGQMQQAMQAMQAAQADAKQVQQAQAQAMQQAGQVGKNGKGGQQGGDGKNGQGAGGQGDGEGQQAQAVPGDQGKGEGEFQAGDPNAANQGGGIGGPGIGNGTQTRNKAAAGYGLKGETDTGDDNKEGKILANTLIKDNQPVKGSSKVGLAQVTESTKKQESEEVDEDHVSGPSRKAAEEYFRTMRQDVQQAPVK